MSILLCIWIAGVGITFILSMFELAKKDEIVIGDIIMMFLGCCFMWWIILWAYPIKTKSKN